MNDLETLLAASCQIADLKKQLLAKDALIASLEQRLREQGMRRLWADIQDQANLDASLPVSMFHRPQI